MRRIVLIFLAGVTFASCAPQPASVSTSTPSPTIVPAAAHATEIRFALVGQPQDINVWQLFDESGASYADYAFRSEYWPRLYHLEPPQFDVQPFAADGMPSAVIQEGDGYSATIKLRSDLKWTDGSAFSAQDVAFTANTALKYELGYDWGSYYPSEYLTRVEVMDPLTVKFYFRKKPDVGAWYYSVLQGPIVQKAFWESRITESGSLLPNETLEADIATAITYQAKVKVLVDEISAQLNQLSLNGKENRQLSGELVKRQEELSYANNALARLQDEYAMHVESAQQALYAIDDQNEPTLGTWISADEKKGIWTNAVNPDFPFIRPNFDRAIYKTYTDQESAYAAFENGEVDVILGSTYLLKMQPSFRGSPRRMERFLVFNPDNHVLQDLNLRKVLACIISDAEQIGFLQGAFVLNDIWKNKDVSLPCKGLSSEQKIEKSIDFLKREGYQWSQQPDASQQGSGLTLPDGTEFPRLVLLLSNMDFANWIQQQALHLGIPLDVQSTDSTSLQYALYSSKKYDMAIVGWRLSDYPGYLCDWFGAGGQFEYASSRLQSACEALAIESDLEVARGQLFTIQSILSEDLPFIPLYTEFTYDVFQNVEYPFENVTGGLSGLYGAPSYAIPAN